MKEKDIALFVCFLKCVFVVLLFVCVYRRLCHTITSLTLILQTCKMKAKRNGHLNVARVKGHSSRRLPPINIVKGLRTSVCEFEVALSVKLNG